MLNIKIKIVIIDICYYPLNSKQITITVIYI